MRIVIPSLVAILAAIAPGSAQQATLPIEELNRGFMEAFNRGDAAALARMYTEDAYVLPPGAPLVKGRGAVEKLWAAAMGQFAEVSLQAVDVKMLGDGNAREVGIVNGKTKGAQAQEVTGKYVVVWRRAGSDWKMETDIWNLDR